MKFSTIVTALFAAMAAASPTFTTATAEDSIAVDAKTPTDLPLCTFDPVKGEYVCPAPQAETSIESTTNEADTSSQDNTAVVAADCNKCRADWDECMKHWGCWFYDCNGPCKCDVGRKDPSCTTCEFGKC
ncbi:hypothetical protein EKO04_002622 [Ascochyta lentis]|uniref:Uncharacterized protein n=1 Tax=Ascochyta lentis TaxID=205686 RepID=A0A8H7MMC6_9PLEO|nr:hypothetical protein EKO04_002622 [Ascochyta lentis]